MLSILPEKWHTRYLEDADPYSEISFLNFKTYIRFWANLVQKSHFSIFAENWHTEYHDNSYSHISFLKFQT